MELEKVFNGRSKRVSNEKRGENIRLIVERPEAARVTKLLGRTRPTDLRGDGLRTIEAHDLTSRRILRGAIVNSASV